MHDLQSPESNTLDRYFQSLSMLSDGKDLPRLSEKCGEIHEMRIRDKTALPAETKTERGALGDYSEAPACCRAEDGTEQE